MGRSRQHIGRSAILALLLGTAVPVLAQGAPAGVSLHDRIARADNGDMPFANPKEELAAMEAMRAEVAKGMKIDARDLLVLDKLRAVATAHTGDFPGATAMMNDVVARTRAQRLDQDPMMVSFLENLGTMESLHGDPSKGLTVLQAALDLVGRQAEPDLDELAAIEGNIGYSYLRLGRVVEAMRHLRKAVDGRSPGGNTRVAYLGSMNTLVSSLARLGDYDEALRYAELGLQRAAEWLPPNHVGFAYFHMNTATTYADSGRLAEAEASYRRALTVLDAHPGINVMLAGVAVGKLADIAVRQGRLEEAEALARRSLEAVKDNRTSERGALGTGWVRLGRILLARGDDSGAVAAVDSAKAAYVERGDTANDVWQAHELLARTRLLQGDPAAALAASGEALGLLAGILPLDAPERIDAEALHALILARLGRNTEAWERAQPLLVRMSAALADPRTSRRARLAIAPFYRSALSRLADVAAASGHPAEAFRTAQLASFTEISASSLALAARAASRDPATGADVRAVQDLQERIDHLGRERSFAQGKSAEQTARIDADLKTAQADLDTRLAALRRAFPDYDALTLPAPLDPAAAQAGLRADQALLLPVQSDDRLTSLVLTPAGLTVSSAQLAQRDANAHLDGGAGATTPFDAGAAWQLGGAIFTKPALAALARSREIDIVGSGPLMTLPPGLLLLTAPQPRTGTPDLATLSYALRRFAFAVRPTVAKASPPTAGAAVAFLGVGAPVLGPSNEVLRGAGSSAGLLRGSVADAATLRALPSLPRAGDELTAMARALPTNGSVLLTGPAASEAAVRAQPLARFGLLAFATHGLISGELRGLDEPALVLTPPTAEPRSSDDDGLLTASEIAGLKLDAQWVILSACNTGAGTENGAGGYSGLARGFMQAGARSLLVSLWPVRDDVAARLTVEAVRGAVRGLSKAEALRRSELRLIADRKVPGGADPAIWAPFSLVVQ